METKGANNDNLGKGTIRVQQAKSDSTPKVEPKPVPKKTEEKKDEKKVKVNFFKTKKGCIITALSLGTVILVSAGSAIYKHLAYKKCPDLSSTSLSDTLLENKDQTCFDELIASENFESYINDVNELESSLELKLVLESLGLDKYNAGLKSTDVSNLTISDIELLIEDYNNLKSEIDFNTPNEKTLSFEQTVSKLTTYKTMLTENNHFETVESINNYTELLIKSLVVDSLGWSDIDISRMSTNLLDLNSEEFKVSFESELGKKYDIVINENNSIYYLVFEVRELNRLVETTKPLLTTGDEQSIDIKEFHEKYEIIINRLKLVQQFNYECNNGVMKQEGNNITKKLY